MILGRLKIAGHSMEPTIHNGQTVLVSSLLYFFSKPKINDIVAFRINSKILIKRISKIQNSMYYVSGDNIDDSFDSKKFGFIARKQIIGKVINFLI